MVSFESKRQFSNGDIDFYISELCENERILPEKVVRQICRAVKDLLIEEDSVKQVPAPAVIVGDIHGQFFDMLQIFEIAGQTADINYVWLGDYVDRGNNSVEVWELLMLLKLRYPHRVTLLRGNHESRGISRVYGFYDECYRKYGSHQPYKCFTEVFDYLTLTAVVANEVFCVHGGLSPELFHVDQVRLLDRVGEVPDSGPIADLLWSDPESISSDTGFAHNSRGAGYMFNSLPVRYFLHTNNLRLVARAHQLVQEGIQYWFSEPMDLAWVDDSLDEGLLATVWSAPNYCYVCGNKASVMIYEGNGVKSTPVFEEVPKSSKAANIRQLLPYFV